MPMWIYDTSLTLKNFAPLLDINFFSFGGAVIFKCIYANYYVFKNGGTIIL